MPLDKYKSMRDFERTEEPSGEADPAISEHERAGRPRFTIQEHHATALHWDFRLERGGVLVSWAVPKGLPPDPRVNNLAVHTEDHPLSYFDFHGAIPKGEYGGGQVYLWDTGWYEEVKWSDREVMVVLHGERARGKYVLFKTGRSNRDWMVHRMDPPDDPARELVPAVVRPARLRPAPGATGDRYEVAWGGTRLALVVDGGRVTAFDEAGATVAGAFGPFGRAVGSLPVVFEGELVKQATLFLSDVVWMDGHATTALPFAQRRALLERLELDGPAWKTAPLYEDAELLLEAARAQGLPGVVARCDAAPWAEELLLLPHFQAPFAS